MEVASMEVGSTEVGVDLDAVESSSMAVEDGSLLWVLDVLRGRSDWLALEEGSTQMHGAIDNTAADTGGEYGACWDVVSWGNDGRTKLGLCAGGLQLKEGGADRAQTDGLLNVVVLLTDGGPADLEATLGYGRMSDIHDLPNDARSGV